jgi:hypothetical protein
LRYFAKNLFALCDYVNKKIAMAAVFFTYFYAFGGVFIKNGLKLPVITITIVVEKEKLMFKNQYYP